MTEEERDERKQVEEGLREDLELDGRRPATYAAVIPRRSRGRIRSKRRTGQSPRHSSN